MPVNNESQEGVGNGNSNDNVVKPKGPSPFGEARPREEVLAEKGHDWKKIDEQLESMKIKSPTKYGLESDTLLPPLQNPDDKIESKNSHPIPNPIIINKKEGEVLEVVSQLSEEPCSISRSFSTTTTVTEKREEEVTSKRNIREGTTTMIKNHKWNSNRFPSRKRPHACDDNVASGRERSVEEEGVRVGIGE
ncbi:Eukaryotic translation initiation factor [Arachis hypogaea]|nr:Eukaryotic translation initiation factor [Arachis hypogaea]